MGEPSSALFRGRGTQQVAVVSQAAPPRSKELGRRQRNYLISMSIRVACFVAMVFVHGWLRWACLAGAALIPWFAVILANVATKGIPAPPPAVAEEQPKVPEIAPGAVIRGEWTEE